MDYFQAIVLALIQGVSEFLPISSSAHLILPSQLLGWPDQGLAFDVAVHVGSLLAVLIYFRRDVSHIVFAFVGQAFSRALNHEQAQRQKQDARLGWMIIVGTVPAVLVALFARDFIEAHLRSTFVIATTTLLFGLLLGLADWKSRGQHTAVQLTVSIALCIGVAQVFSLIPGTSRSGVTITAAVLLGLSRTDAARFSFLLSIPIILAAGSLLSLELLTSDTPIDWVVMLVGVVVSGVSAWICIALFLRLIERIGFMPFVIYRLLLGVGLLLL